MTLMKTFPLSFPCPRAIVLIVLFGGASLAHSALNNGDFEMGSTAGWQVYNPDGQPLGWGVTSDPANVHSGNYAGALTAFGGTNSTLIIHNDLDVSDWPADSVCLARMHIKTESLQLTSTTRGLRSIIVVRNGANDILGYYDHNAGLWGTDDYTALETLFILPPGAIRVELQLVLDAGILSGAAYLDEADLLRVTNSGALLNGGFETGSTAGWQVFNPDGQPLNWSVTSDPANVHSGSHAGALTAFDGTNSTLILHNSVDVSAWPADSMLVAKLRLKTDALELADSGDSLRMVVAIWDDANQVIAYSYMNGNFLGTQEYTPVEVFISLPHGAKQAEIQLALRSGIVSGAVFVDDADIRQVSDPGDLSEDIPMAEIKRDAGGTPRLHIDGGPRAPNFFFGNSGHPVIYDEMRLAAGAGLDFISIPVALPWEGSGTGMIEQSLRASPNALFLLRLSLYPPAWWMKERTSLLFADENGAPHPQLPGPSLASDEFITACKDQLEKLIRFLHNSPYRSRIIGYHFDYLSEWFYLEIANHFWDYSEVNRQRFIQWLQTRYVDVAALNAAWDKSYASFTDVQIPSAAEWQSGNDGVFRDPTQQRAVPDYAEYHNHLVADRIAELAAHIKNLTAGKSLVAAFYGYTTHLIINGGNRGIAHSGHLALKRLLASPDIDILCSPVAYFQREVGEPSDMMSVVDTVTLAGKLYLQEEDSNTYLIDPSDNPDNSNPWYSTEWDTMQCLRRNYGNVVGHNQAMWWMDLWADGRFNTESIWTNNALVMRTSADVVAEASPFQPQVAVLFDEETFFWLKSDSDELTRPNVLELRSLFQSLGAAVGYYLVEDLPKIPASAKLLVFANTHRLDAAERTLIQAAKSSGRTFLWLYAPGYVSESNLSVDSMADVTGFTFVRNGTSINPSIRIEPGSVSPITIDLANHTFGSQSSITPTFHVSPAAANDVLGRYTGNNQPALVAQDHGAWKSVFCGAPKPSPQMLRGIARYAGVNLLADGDSLDSTNAVNYIAPYLYVYAMNNAGRRGFQLPGEKIPNGGFEKFTGALPTSGFGRWISPRSGTLATCTVIHSNSAAGDNACATGPFVSGAGQYSEPLAIRLQAERGRTYQVSCELYVDGLNTNSSVDGDYIYFVVQPHDWTPDSWTASIAQGPEGLIADKTWTRLEGSFTFTGGDAPYENDLVIVLKVFGAYSANNLLIDNVSVREDGCEPVDVVEIVSNTVLGRNVTSWADDFALNEQKIFRLTPSADAFNIADIQLLGPDLLRLQWQSLSAGYRYTVEEADGLPPEWLPAAGTNVWPVSATEAVLPIGNSRKLFRLKAQP